MMFKYFVSFINFKSLKWFIRFPDSLGQWVSERTREQGSSMKLLVKYHGKKLSVCLESI